MRSHYTTAFTTAVQHCQPHINTKPAAAAADNMTRTEALEPLLPERAGAAAGAPDGVAAVAEESCILAPPASMLSGNGSCSGAQRALGRVAGMLPTSSSHAWICSL